MLRWALLVIVGGCGGSSSVRDAAPEASSPDGPPDAPDALPARCTPRSGTDVVLRRIAVVDQPAVLVTSPPYDPRLFVVGQYGQISIIDNDQLLPTPFLTITRPQTNLDSGGEQGLLGLAFHPKFAQNGIFFIYYTITISADATHHEVVARYRVSSTNPNVAEPTGEVMLQIRADARNHNAGMLEFGDDGYLYIGTGDSSGPAGFLHSQDTQSLLGKVLRLDVDHPANGKLYGIPPTNPFADGANGAPEVFISGLRNPWRWSFDRSNYDMYIADVGQDVIEELTIIPRAQQKAANLGWYPFEGASCVPGQTCDPTGKTFPQLTKDHDNDGWCAIVGGQVYRGPCMPDVTGTYFFSDYCAGGLWSLKATAGQITTAATVSSNPMPAMISSIHADERGELFATTTNGEVFQLELAP